MNRPHRSPVRGLGPIGLAIAIAAVLAALALSVAAPARADDDPWTTPVNLSASGSGSLPTVVIAADGSNHALWWDAFAGAMHASTGPTDTLWTRPITVPIVWGQRTLITDTRTRRVTATYSPPRQMSLISDAREDGVSALWVDSVNRLLGARLSQGKWSAAETLGEAVLTSDVVADLSGTLRLAFARSVDAAGAPAGIYYRSRAPDNTWGAPVLVYPSLYFRTLLAQNAHVSVAADPAGRAIVAWDDPTTQASYYARTLDGGATWSSPSAVINTASGPATRAQVATTPQGEWLLLWQDAAGGACRFTEQRSTDAGETWSPPARVLSDLARCPEQVSFLPDASGRLWLVGAAGGSRGVLAVRGETGWSEPVDISMRIYDANVSGSISLGCLRLSISGQQASAIGCDTRGDIWAAQSAVPLDQMVPALLPTWDTAKTISDPGTSLVAAEDMPALAADRQGRLIALWGQYDTSGYSDIAIWASVWNGNNWSPAARILPYPASETETGESSQTLRAAEQPSAVFDNKGRLHTVWVDGAKGGIYYAWATLRDATSPQGWLDPIRLLPESARVGSSPRIATDPQGNLLYVLYAIPLNEGRGIYLLRSLDGGATWQPPTLVFDAAAAGWGGVDRARLAVDPSGTTLHAAWLHTEPGSRQAQEVHTARSDDGGATWSPAVMIASGTVDWPVLTVPITGHVHLAWHVVTQRAGAPSAGDYEAWEATSADGGGQWSRPARITGFDRVDGPIGIMSDTAGRLFAAAIGQKPSGESALLYMRHDGQAWSERETYGLGQPGAAGSLAMLALPAGSNRLHAITRSPALSQAGDLQFRIQALSRQSDAASPAIAPETTDAQAAPVALPASATAAPAGSASSETGAAAPAAGPRPTVSSDLGASGAGILQSLPPMMPGVVAAAIMVVIGAAIYLVRQNARQ